MLAEGEGKWDLRRMSQAGTETVVGLALETTAGRR